MVSLTYRDKDKFRALFNRYLLKNNTKYIRISSDLYSGFLKMNGLCLKEAFISKTVIGIFCNN